jgi:hypothetical protein
VCRIHAGYCGSAVEGGFDEAAAVIYSHGLRLGSFKNTTILKYATGKNSNIMEFRKNQNYPFTILFCIFTHAVKVS